jgi:hypothetical protein
LEDLGTDGRNIKMDLKETVQPGVEWIPLAQHGDIQWAFVNTIMNLWIPQMQEIS